MSTVPTSGAMLKGFYAKLAEINVPAIVFWVDERRVPQLSTNRPDFLPAVVHFVLPVSGHAHVAQTLHAPTTPAAGDPSPCPVCGSAEPWAALADENKTIHLAQAEKALRAMHEFALSHLNNAPIKRDDDGAAPAGPSA